MTVSTTVVIPCFNAWQYTEACLASLAHRTPEPHDVVLVDNGSTDGTSERFASLGPGTLIRNDENLGFSLAANQGIEQSAGDVVVLLNNDTILTEGWLGALLDALSADADVGVAVPVSNFVIDPQKVPVTYSAAPGAELDAFAADRAHRFAGKGRDTTRISGLCMAIRRDLLAQIGGFDPRFRLGNFEDDDFALRARAAGWRLRLREDSFVHHFGHRTFTQLDEDFDALLHENAARFCMKWDLPLDRDPRGCDPPRPFDPQRDRVPLDLATHVRARAGEIPRMGSQVSAAPAD
ncbi:MAG: glycosyltransferase family 2 protein [Miltoncostaeaceae bacterium]